MKIAELQQKGVSRESCPVGDMATSLKHSQYPELKLTRDPTPDGLDARPLTHLNKVHLISVFNTNVSMQMSNSNDI